MRRSIISSSGQPNGSRLFSGLKGEKQDGSVMAVADVILDGLSAMILVNRSNSNMLATFLGKLSLERIVVAKNMNYCCFRYTLTKTVSQYNFLHESFM